MLVNFADMKVIGKKTIEYTVYIQYLYSKVGYAYTFMLTKFLQTVHI